MKKTILNVVGLLLFISTHVNAVSDIFPERTTLSGIVTDKNTGESLPGVSIYIPDLKTGSVTNADGKYLIENLPESKVKVQVSLVGYKLIIESVDLSNTTTKNFQLEESVAELNEVVVTGQTQSTEINKTPTPVSIISKTQLLQTSSTNIIDAISKQPGISQVTTGAGISKPVIRGLGYNRVVVVNDGIRQEGQQWGDEHGVEIDEFSVSKVEILKGPASLTFGSDAMAGVINFITAPTLPNGIISGNFLSNYQTNSGLFGNSANVAGNLNGLIWDVRYSNKMAHAYQNKYDGYVFNSGYRENNFGGVVGVNKSWGYSHLHFSVYNLTPGIVEGERDSASGKFVKPVVFNDSTEGREVVTDNELTSYTSLTPYQKIHHYKLVLNNSFIIKNGSLKTILGWQQNQRQEFSDVLQPDHYGLYFLLNTINYEARYILPEKNGFNISFGANGMYQTSQNKGTEFLIPEYDLFDIGAFGIIAKSFGKLDVSGGLRYDTRTDDGKELFLKANGEIAASSDPASTQKFAAFNSTFSGVSGSLGASYEFSERIFSKINVSRGFRAPNINELAANGVHDGTVRYEIGDPTLNPENSLQWDLALGLNTEHVTGEIDFFSSHISNFIFPVKLNSTFGGDSLSDGYQTYKFVSGDADLSGGEISIDIHPHPLDWLHFENSFSYVQSEQKGQPDSTKYLPFTPAPKFSSELKATSRSLSKRFNNAYIEFGLDKYFDQNKFYSTNGTETATPGYVLLNFGLGTDVMSKEKTLFSFFISINNLGDVAYQSHLSRLKYGEINYSTGRTGVYNMGRNFSFKILVPIDFRKGKEAGM